MPILPILKGDAYGHGAPIVAAFLKSRGFSLLGVGTLEEALEILQIAAVTLLVLSPPLTTQLPLFLKYPLIPTISSLEQMQTLVQLATKRRQEVTIHVKVDTGFGRLGVDPRDLVPLVRQIKGLPYVRLGGVFTHFPAASKDPSFTKKQIRSFLDLKKEVEALGGFHHVLWHGANSAAFLKLPTSHLDLVRIGTLCYGQSPASYSPPWDLRETWKFKTRIIHVRLLPKGHSVGYGREYHTRKPTRIGVIPIGYGQGLELEPVTTPCRQLKLALVQERKRQHVVHHTQGPLPILGRVGMGLTSVDLSSVPEAQVGDCVTVDMRRVTAGAHVPRFYYLAGQMRCVFWNHQLRSPEGHVIRPKSLF